MNSYSISEYRYPCLPQLESRPFLLKKSMERSASNASNSSGMSAVLVEGTTTLFMTHVLPPGTAAQVEDSSNSSYTSVPSLCRSISIYSILSIYEHEEKDEGFLTKFLNILKCY